MKTSEIYAIGALAAISIFVLLYSNKNIIKSDITKQDSSVNINVSRPEDSTNLQIALRRINNRFIGKSADTLIEMYGTPKYYDDFRGIELWCYDSKIRNNDTIILFEFSIKDNVIKHVRCLGPSDDYEDDTTGTESD